MKTKSLLPILVVVFLFIYLISNAFRNSAMSNEDKSLQQTTIPTTYGVSNVQYELPYISKDDIIIRHTGYELSYNMTTNCPNWVAWELTGQEAESNEIKRIDSFKPDKQIPKSNRVYPAEYKNSGYDKGHMCPAADMKWSTQSMEDSFYMTNMCPQSPTLNRQWWQHLEDACRRWAMNDGRIYICCGPVYYGENKTFIGNKVLVQVPDAFFKVVVSLKEGNERGIGFIYWNDDSRQIMSDVVMTINDIEFLTGFDFFTNVDDAIEERIESEANLKLWQ